MKIKNIIAVVVTLMAAVFCLAGCSKDTSAEDMSLQQKLMGCWVPVNDAEQVVDDEGNIVRFSVYEFTETETRIHLVEMERTESYVINEYSIYNGKYKVMVENTAQFAKIEFGENGNMFWVTDTSRDEFRPLTEEEIKEFGIPVGKESIYDNMIDLDQMYQEQYGDGAASEAAAAE